MLNREKSKRRMPEKKIVKGNQNLNLRKNWIDALRGLAMLFVLYGHLVHGWNEYFVFTSAIKIPLFFQSPVMYSRSEMGELGNLSGIL